MESQLHRNPREGFLLGELFGIYALELPGDADEHVQQGYSSVPDAQKGKGVVVDRFVRKYVQIRANAWRRNRLVDDSFTVQLLRELDVERCPVSGVVLTHRTGDDTDWSIDRLDNNKGYVKGNLAVMSSRVNRLKKYYTPSQVHKRAVIEEDLEGLTAQEWARLDTLVHCAVSSPQTDAEPVQAFCAFDELPPCLAWHPCLQLQGYLAAMVFSFSANERRDSWESIEAAVPADKRHLVRALKVAVTEIVRSKTVSILRYWELFQDSKVWRIFAALWPSYFPTRACTQLLRYTQSCIDENLHPQPLDVERLREHEAVQGYC